jgi:transposase-like protein
MTSQMIKVKSHRMYNGICTLKFKINYNLVNYDKKTGFHNNNEKRWKCEKCDNSFFKGFKELKDHKADYHSY